MEDSQLDVRMKEIEWMKGIENGSRGQIKCPNDDVESKEERNKEETGESSESEAEMEPARSFHRKLSTNKEIKDTVS